VVDEEPTAPYLDAIRRAFQFAREHQHRCGPADFLVGLAEGSGPAAGALRPGPGQSVRQAAAASGLAREGAGYQHMQAQEAARSLAAQRGQAAGPEHLLLALLDQSTPKVTDVLARAGLNPGEVRRAALAAIGAPLDLRPVPLPPPTPAGTLDRPALPVPDLDPRAWAVLRWRQDHLPLAQLHRSGDLQALSHLERSAAWRLADRLALDGDQRYSLLDQHDAHVTALAARAHPDVAPAAPPGRRPRPRGPIGRLTVGWPAWFSNRRVSLRDRWFQVRTVRSYRGCPQP
jgi:hypothetical protein